MLKFKRILVLALFAVIISYHSSDAKLFLSEDYELEEDKEELKSAITGKTTFSKASRDISSPKGYIKTKIKSTLTSKGKKGKIEGSSKWSKRGEKLNKGNTESDKGKP